MIEFNVLKKRNVLLIDEIAAAGRAALVGTPVAQALFSPGVFRLTTLRGIWSLLRAFRHHRREFLAGRRYRFLNAIEGMTGPQAAIAYVLRHPRISTAVFGTTQIRHLQQNVAAGDMTLPQAIVDRIEQLPDA